MSLKLKFFLEVIKHLIFFLAYINKQINQLQDLCGICLSFPFDPYRPINFGNYFCYKCLIGWHKNKKIHVKFKGNLLLWLFQKILMIWKNISWIQFIILKKIFIIKILWKLIPYSIFLCPPSKFALPSKKFFNFKKNI